MTSFPQRKKYSSAHGKQAEQRLQQSNVLLHASSLSNMRWWRKGDLFTTVKLRIPNPNPVQLKFRNQLEEEQSPSSHLQWFPWGCCRCATWRDGSPVSAWIPRSTRGVWSPNECADIMSRVPCQTSGGYTQLWWSRCGHGLGVIWLDAFCPNSNAGPSISQAYRQVRREHLTHGVAVSTPCPFIKKKNLNLLQNTFGTFRNMND